MNKQYWQLSSLVCWGCAIFAMYYPPPRFTESAPLILIAFAVFCLAVASILKALERRP